MFPYDAAISLVDTLPIGSKVDLFGGEPTMHPNFFDILNNIYTKGMECSVATNGRYFSKRKFFKRVADITKESLYVRTSLYGLSATEHDLATGVKGSYDELMAGLNNIVATDMVCQVNIVITKKNISSLEEMTRLIVNKKVGRIKFGLLINCSSCPTIVPSLSEIRNNLIRSVKIAKLHGLKVTIEKAPLCIAPEYMNNFSGERDLGQWSRVFDDDGNCGDCLMRRWCDGLDPDYVNLFGTKGISKILKIHPTVVSPFPLNVQSANVKFLKLNLFCLPDGKTSLGMCEKIVSGVLEEGRKKLARIAFVPDSQIRSERIGPARNRLAI